MDRRIGGIALLSNWGRFGTAPLRHGVKKIMGTSLSAAILLLNACQPKSSSQDASLIGDAPTVDGGQALDKVRQLVQFSPRPSGSPNAEKAAAWIAAESRRQGLQVRTHEWTDETPAGVLTFRNVVAVSPGHKSGRILLGSHYDTKYLPEIPGFQGANDSGSSTGLLLVLMKALADIPPEQRCTLEYVFFDGEECRESYTHRDGLHGSRYHARQIEERGDIEEYRAMILLDMVGDRDLRITIPMDTPARLARPLFAVAEQQGVRDKFGYFPRGNIIDDHVPFTRLGIPALNLIDFEYGPGNRYWHTAEDTLDKLSAESLEIVGNVTLELVIRLLVDQP